MATTINANHSGAKSVKFIDSLIKIRGITTGYRIDIPCRFTKIV